MYMHFRYEYNLPGVCFILDDLVNGKAWPPERNKVSPSVRKQTCSCKCQQWVRNQTQACINMSQCQCKSVTTGNKQSQCKSVTTGNKQSQKKKCTTVKN